jgi:CRP-like cAMP-binding protein
MKDFRHNVSGKTPQTPVELKTVPLFSRLSSAYLGLIEANCKELSFPKGATILEQQEPTFDLYVILSGKAKVSLVHKDGREIVLNILREGDFFGELSFFDKRSRSAMIVALTGMRMLFLPRDTFMGILRSNSEIAIHLLYGMAGRLRKANESIQTLTFLDVSGRVAKYLIDLACHSGERLQDGYVKVVCPTHQAIAHQIGASREAVTKAMKSLISNGLIAAKDKEVIIAPRQFEIL